MPVLFYAPCAVLAPTEHGSATFFVAGGWVFVFLRYVHSFIHLTYNRVTHRFAVHAVSTVVLFVLWGGFAVRVLS